MKLIITPTEKITTVDGHQCRVWDGRLPDGAPCQLFVARVTSTSPAAQRQLEKVLAEMPEPLVLDYRADRRVGLTPPSEEAPK